MIDRLAATGIPVDRCCRVLGVSRQGYYRYKRRATSATQLRRQWLTGLIREVHVASRGTYGYRRIHAELTMAMNVRVSSRLVSVLMTHHRTWKPGHRAGHTVNRTSSNPVYYLCMHHTVSSWRSRQFGSLRLTLTSRYGTWSDAGRHLRSVLQPATVVR